MKSIIERTKLYNVIRWKRLEAKEETEIMVSVELCRYDNIAMFEKASASAKDSHLKQP